MRGQFAGTRHRNEKHAKMADSRQTISIERDYILVERQPNYEVIPSEQSSRLLEISSVCEQTGFFKVLVTGPHTKVHLSTMDIYALGEQMSRLGMQIAIVETHDASSDDVKLLENVASNRGRPVQFFDTIQEAKDWLGVE